MRTTERHKMTEIFNLCVDITQLSSRKENGPCAFCHYQGHINGIDVSTHERGWIKGHDPDRRFTIYAGRCYGDDIDYVVRYLTDLKEKASTGMGVPDVDANVNNQLQDKPIRKVCQMEVEK